VCAYSRKAYFGVEDEEELPGMAPEMADTTLIYMSTIPQITTFDTKLDFFSFHMITYYY